jgi:hypothetical protein
MKAASAILSFLLLLIGGSAYAQLGNVDWKHDKAVGDVVSGVVNGARQYFKAADKTCPLAPSLRDKKFSDGELRFFQAMSTNDIAKVEYFSAQSGVEMLLNDGQRKQTYTLIASLQDRKCYEFEIYPIMKK